MKRVFKYGFFRGLDPVCPERIRQYPELAEVATAVREGREVNREDLADLQHQWAHGVRPRMMQECFEAGCDVIRPVPLDSYGQRDQTFVLRTFMKNNGTKEKS